MTFERPDLLVAIPVALVLIVAAVLFQWQRGARLVRAYGGPEAARRLLGRDLTPFPALRLLVLLLLTGAIGLAGAGVRRAEVAEAPPVAPVDLIMAIDVSHSMTGTDVEPSRAARARELVEAILEAGVADRAALTLFADWPYGLVPLTDDPRVPAFFGPWITPDLVVTRDQGTSLANLIGHSRGVWEARGREDSNPILLIVSDGEAHGDDVAVLDSVAALTASGIRVWTAGVGTAEGAPLFVPRSEGAPLLDGSGAQVVAEYAPELLEAMADRAEGAFYDISDNSGIDRLVDELRREAGVGGATPELPVDPTAWLIMAGLALAVLEARLDTHRRREGTP